MAQENEVRYTHEPSRRDTGSAEFYPSALVRVPKRTGYAEYRILRPRPTRAVPTVDDATTIMRPIVRRWIAKRGWDGARIIER